NSVRVVDLALRAVGGSSYFKRLPLERLFRDVRAGLYHPFDSDETLEFLGKSAFGIPLFEGLAPEGEPPTRTKPHGHGNGSRRTLLLRGQRPGRPPPRERSRAPLGPGA